MKSKLIEKGNVFIVTVPNEETHFISMSNDGKWDDHYYNDYYNDYYYDHYYNDYDYYYNDYYNDYYYEYKPDISNNPF